MLEFLLNCDLLQIYNTSIGSSLGTNQLFTILFCCSCLLEGCRLLYPTKPRSKHRINSIDQKLSLASNNVTTTQSHHHHHTNNVSLKGKCDHIDDSDDDQDPGATEKKKAKFFNNRDDNVNLNMKKKWVTMNKGKAKVANDLSAPVELPEKFKNVILGLMHGTRLQLLMHKSLMVTDKDMDRLKKDNVLRVQLIDPKLEQVPISLGLWKMSRNSKTEELDDPKRNYVCIEISMESHC